MDIGASLVPSDIFQILKTIPEINYVSNITIQLEYNSELNNNYFLNDQDNEKFSIRKERIIIKMMNTIIKQSVFPFSLICNGIHHLSLK